MPDPKYAEELDVMEGDLCCSTILIIVKQIDRMKC